MLQRAQVDIRGSCRAPNTQFRNLILTNQLRHIIGDIHLHSRNDDGVAGEPRRPRKLRTGSCIQKGQEAARNPSKNSTGIVYNAWCRSHPLYTGPCGMVCLPSWAEGWQRAGARCRSQSEQMPLDPGLNVENFIGLASSMTHENLTFYIYIFD